MKQSLIWIWKSKFRNPKHEIRNKLEIPRPLKIRNGRNISERERQFETLPFSNFVSDFDIRVLDLIQL